MGSLTMNIQSLSNTYQVKHLTKKDIPQIYQLCLKNPQYYHHCPPAVSIDSIKEDMAALPVGKRYDDKYYIGFFNHDELIAVMDLVVKYPDEQTAFIGFFMMNQEYQGNGIGSKIIEDVCDDLKDSFSYVRLGYVKTNHQSEHFWLKNHFEPTGIIKETPDYDIVVLQRSL